VFHSSSFASDEKAWPWVLFSREIEYCAKFNDPLRSDLLVGVDTASHSTQNLLPDRIWIAYKRQIVQAGIGVPPSEEDRAFCNAFTARLSNPKLSSVLRGELFLGHMYYAVFDCLVDNQEKGPRLLIDLRAFYQRNDVEFPEELVREDLAAMRVSKRKIHNGWNTPHCADLQKAISNHELDSAISEAGMRRSLLDPQP
jgi:hypothetical protein